MDVYRVNGGEWFPTLEEARAAAKDVWGDTLVGYEQGEQAEDGTIQVTYITIC